MSTPMVMIGNGPSVLDIEAGGWINSQAVVCRLNWFKIGGFEKYVGTICDIWVTCNQREAVLQRAGMFKKVYFPLHQHKFIELSKEVPGSEYFPKSNYDKASMINGKWFYPSTGLLATVFFLDMGYDITLHGFDFFQRDKHHYCDEQKIGINHSPENELKAFETLMKSGKVKVLTNESIDKT